MTQDEPEREIRTVQDPFLGKTVEVSNRLTDRLRGHYACGPTLASGEPEFGWNEYPTPPIQREAADEIERLRLAISVSEKRAETLEAKLRMTENIARMTGDERDNFITELEATQQQLATAESERDSSQASLLRVRGLLERALSDWEPDLGYNSLGKEIRTALSPHTEK